MVRDEIQFVEIPEHLLEAVGVQEPGTRVFRQIGGRAEYDAWWDAILTICGPEAAVSPGGASMLAPVSRAAVYKRMKEGRLTAFVFHEVPKGYRWSIKRLLGTAEYASYGFVPVSELRSWGRLLEQRGVRAPEEWDDSILKAKREDLRKYLRKEKARKRGT